MNQMTSKNGKPNTNSHSHVAVILKKQPIIPIFLTIIEEYRKSGINIQKQTSSEITITLNENTKLWLDYKLIKEAIFDTIEYALPYYDPKDLLVFNFTGMGKEHCYVHLFYTLLKSYESKYEGILVNPYFYKKRTLDIFAQHHVTITHRQTNKKVDVKLSFDK